MDKKRITERIKEKDYNRYIELITVCLCVLAALFVVWTFNGQWPWKAQPYNSYILQVQSWLQGRLDIDNRPYLELAIFNDKYFVSFPPFPSYLMLPFVAIGWNSCDGMIALAASLAGAVYAYLILEHFGIKGTRAILAAMFVTIGSNWLMTATNAYVWFIAQNLAFTLSLMAIYYALKGKAGLSLSFWACAVGCRPFDFLYIPVLLYILYKKHMDDNPNDKLVDIIKKKWRCCIAPFLIALSYMILNYVRFESIIEFGHNYLPEHTRSELGQFHWSYLPGNLKNLVRLPSVNEKGVWEYSYMNGMNWFFVSPITVAYIIYAVNAIVKKKTVDKILSIMIAVLTVIMVVALAAHVQMGGAHFGNRYPNDALPFVFLGLSIFLPKEKGKFENLIIPLFILGICLNMIGVTNYYIR